MSIDTLFDKLRIVKIPYVPEHSQSEDSLHLLEAHQADGLQYQVTIDSHSKYGKITYDKEKKEFSVLFLHHFNFISEIYCPLKLKSLAIHIVDPKSFSLQSFKAKRDGVSSELEADEIIKIDVSRQVNGIISLPKICISGINSVPYRAIKLVYSVDYPKDPSRFGLTVSFIGLKTSEVCNQLNALFDTKEKIVEYLKSTVKYQPDGTVSEYGFFSYISSMIW